MKPGDRVRIKSFNEIKGKDNSSWERNGFYTNNLDIFFSFDMKKFCGSIVTLTTSRNKHSGTIWKVKENIWWWDEKWMETHDFLTDKDFEI